MTKKIFKIKGMHCASCASMIELDLEDAGIKSVCNFAKETLEVEDNDNSKKVVEIVKKSGYSIDS